MHKLYYVYSIKKNLVLRMQIFLRLETISINCRPSENIWIVKIKRRGRLPVNSMEIHHQLDSPTLLTGLMLHWSMADSGFYVKKALPRC